ncbi:MAG: tetratricopeptide repeat protein [Alphaproteobacteria bacterium]
MRYAAWLLILGLFGASAAPAAADAAADFARATEAAKKGQRDEAMTLVTKAIESKEATGRDLANMHYFRAELYSEAGKLDESLADYAMTIEIMPDYASAYHDRALVYAQQKKYQEALDDLSRAQFLIPQSPLPYFNRGRVYETMGKREQAIAEYRRARALAPQMKEPQEALRRLGVR